MLMLKEQKKNKVNKTFYSISHYVYSSLSERTSGILFTAIFPFKLPESSALRTYNKNTSSLSENWCGVPLLLHKQ
jgi:hypothetical protein